MENSCFCPTTGPITLTGPNNEFGSGIRIEFGSGTGLNPSIHTGIHNNQDPYQHLPQHRFPRMLR